MPAKKLAPFVDDYLPALLAQTSQLISSEFHEVVRANDFSVTEWRVLASLSGVEGMSVGRLAEVSVTKQPTVTRLLGRLEQKGIVMRLVDETDRRITLVRITPEGEKIIANLIRQAKAHEQHVLAPYGSQRAAAVKKLLRQIIEEHRRSG
jgi:DNA-binding MarR family transcriptional regulator